MPRHRSVAHLCWGWRLDRMSFFDFIALGLASFAGAYAGKREIMQEVAPAGSMRVTLVQQLPRASMR